MTARISVNVLVMAICIAITYFALLYAIMAVGLLGMLAQTPQTQRNRQIHNSSAPAREVRHD